MKLLYMYEETGENNTVNLKKVLFFHWLKLDWFTFFVMNAILERQVNFIGERQECKNEFSE